MTENELQGVWQDIKFVAYTISKKTGIDKEEIINEIHESLEQNKHPREIAKNYGITEEDIYREAIRLYASPNDDYKSYNEMLQYVEQLVELGKEMENEYSPDEPKPFEVIIGTDKWSKELSEKYRIIPLVVHSGEELKFVEIVSDNPFEYSFYNLLSSKFDTTKVKIHFVDPTTFNDLMTKYFREIEVHVEEEDLDLDDSLEDLAQGPIVEFVNTVLSDALAKGASDIHFEPQPDGLKIRFRIDGLLKEQKYPDLENPNVAKSYKRKVVARIKVMANLNITEKRKPQDGRIKFPYKEEQVDIRVSTVPVIYGEKVVLRLLRKDPALLNLDNLGYLPDTLQKLKNLIEQPYGLILVTGPTGSGKSTTLYAALNYLLYIAQGTKNIMTAEDPVEYENPQLNQVPINPTAGLTFAAALRSFLRQDPDVILVGEIRDKETAEIAMHAAMTGHLVFATLHTNSAFDAPARLIDMGIEPFLVANSLIGVLAQRLARRVAKQDGKPLIKPFDKERAIPRSVREAYQELVEGKVMLPPEMKEAFINEPHPFIQAEKYKSRLAIHELLVVNEEIRDLILENAPGYKIQEEALKHDMRTLIHDAIIKMVVWRTIDLKEIMRVIATV